MAHDPRRRIAPRATDVTPGSGPPMTAFDLHHRFLTINADQISL
jgi:hypothetical protein